MWDMGVMVGHGEDRMLPNLEAEAVLMARDGCPRHWDARNGVPWQ